MSPRTGRPRKENPKSERLFIRVTPQEKQDIMNASCDSGLSLLELLKIGVASVKKK